MQDATATIIPFRAPPPCSRTSRSPRRHRATRIELEQELAALQQQLAATQATLDGYIRAAVQGAR